MSKECPACEEPGTERGDGRSNPSKRLEDAPDRRRGAQPGNANATRHGLSALRRRLKGAGLKRNDGRSALERIKADWKAEIREARGELSPQEEVLLEAASTTWLLLNSVDAWLLEQRSLVNRRKRELLPVVQQRAGLVRNLRELLGDVGLKRVPKPSPRLADHVAERYGANRVATAADAHGSGDAGDVAAAS